MRTIKKINHEQLELTAERHYEKGKALIILGRTGIGKSQSFYNMAKRKAEEKGKEFIDMKDIDKTKLQEIIRNPDKYFVLKILSMSTISDPTDLKGLPFPEMEEVMKNRVVKWLKNEWVMVLEKCEGIILLDEFNLAPSSIQAIVYQMLLDKRIDDVKLHEGVGIACAGNLTEDRAGVYELPKPIRTRAGVYELMCPSSEEFMNYGLKNKLDTRIITFIHKFPSRVFVENEKVDDVVCPRGWFTVSDLIKDIRDLDEIGLYSSGVLGEAIAQEFVSQIKLGDKIPSPEEMLSGKAKIPKEIDLKHACVTAIAEYFGQQKEKGRTEVIKQIINLHKELDAEFYLLTLRICKGIQEDIFKKLIGMKEFDAIMKYSEYLR